MISTIRTGIVVVAFGLAGVLGAGASPANAAVEADNLHGLAGDVQVEAEVAASVWHLHSKHASVVGCNNTGFHLQRQDLISDFFCTLQPDGWWWLMITMM